MSPRQIEFKNTDLLCLKKSVFNEFEKILLFRNNYSYTKLIGSFHLQQLPKANIIHYPSLFYYFVNTFENS